MAKVRFRKVKQGKLDEAILDKKANQESKKIAKSIYPTARERIKAFITDSFMILMPIMYIVIYLIMGSREGFAQDKLLGWLYIVIPYAVITMVFIIKAGQTPGMKAYSMRVVSTDGKRVNSISRILIRQILGVVDFLLFGWVLMFFRKDRRTPHELLTATMLIKDEDEPK